MNFYDFFYLFEIAGEDPTTMNTDDIQLQKRGRSFTFTFDMDGENYTVMFNPTSAYLSGPGGSQDVTQNSYSITLEGPEGYKPTGRGKPLTVYKNLIKAVKKLIDQENPEGLQFYGAYPEQDIMYAAFYEKYLHKMYTKVSRKDYLRNDFIEQLKTANDPRWPVVEKGIETEKNSDDIELKKQAKGRQRERRQQIAAGLQQFQPALNKIAWYEGSRMPIVVTRINPSGEISFQYTSSSYMDSSSTQEFETIKPIDQMPNDPKAFKKLQRLVKKLQANGQQPEFWGTPPEGWDQQIANPYEGILKKIAFHESYGPVYITRYSEDTDEVRFKYLSGSYMEDGSLDASELKKLDELPAEWVKRLRKMVKKLTNDGYTYELWGTPPGGWDQDNDPFSGIENKIVYNTDYGPVYITNYDDESNEVSFYYMGNRHLDSSYSRTNRIKPINEMPTDEAFLMKLRKLVRRMRRENGADPQFWGTPPDYETERQTQPFEGKIAYSYDYGPVYVRPHSETDDQDEDEFYGMYVYSGSNLEGVDIRGDTIRSIDDLPNNYVRKLRKLVALLKSREGIEAEFYGTPPQGWDQQGPQQPFINKIAFSASHGPIFVSEEGDDEGEFHMTYISYTGSPRDTFIYANDIQQISQMPTTQFQKLQKLLMAVQRGRGFKPEFYGTPPQGMMQSAVNKIAWTVNTETPVYVKSISGDQAQVWYAHQGMLGTANVETDTLQAFSSMDSYDRDRRMQAVPELQQALQRQGVTNAQVWSGQ